MWIGFVWHRIVCSDEMLWTLYWIFLDEVQRQLLKKWFMSLHPFYPGWSFPFHKLERCKIILSVRIDYIHIFTADSLVNYVSEKILSKLWLTHVCHKFLCPCLLLVPLRKLKYVLNFCEHCTVCHSVLYRAGLSFFLFCVPCLLRSLRRERRLVVPFVKANRVRRRPNNSHLVSSIYCHRRFLTLVDDCLESMIVQYPSSNSEIFWKPVRLCRLQDLRHLSHAQKFSNKWSAVTRIRSDKSIRTS
jgi:hypothetical protein